MPNITTRELSGWGRYPRSQARVLSPESPREIQPLLDGQMIARGLGRSYGNAAMLENGLVVLTERLNRPLEFDRSSGVLTAEAGLALGDVIGTVTSQGWFPAVVPGTKWVSLGGCVAADIHGKNHHRDGTFGAHVKELKVLLADGSLARCSPLQEANLFWATIGGMGLTGFITEITMQLIRVESGWVIARHHPARDLDALLELLELPSCDDAYTVAWLDCMAHGASLGRGILISGHHAIAEELPPHLRLLAQARIRKTVKLNVDFPSWLLNPVTIGTFNELYYRRQGRRRAPFVCDLDSFFFPLDRIGDWNRLYGKRGFVQYQCVLPLKQSRRGLQLLLEESRRCRQPSFLAVLKRFGPAGNGLLSFPLEGCTLTMDFPVTGEKLFLFLDRLDEIVVKHGGRVYLAKDARMRAEVFGEMYKRLPEWRRVKVRVDPDDRFDSDLARRLGIAGSR